MKFTEIVTIKQERDDKLSLGKEIDRTLAAVDRKSFQKRQLNMDVKSVQVYTNWGIERTFLRLNFINHTSKMSGKLLLNYIQIYLPTRTYDVHRNIFIPQLVMLNPWRMRGKIYAFCSLLEICCILCW